MHLRNGEHGYGAVTKALHWLTVAAIAAQFFVGYTMETEADVPEVDCDPPGDDRSGGDLSDAESDRLDQLEEECEEAQDRLEDAADDTVGTAWSDLLSGDLAGDGAVAARGPRAPRHDDHRAGRRCGSCGVASLRFRPGTRA